MAAIQELGTGKINKVSIYLKCFCCGHVQKFADAQEAFNKDWDLPPFIQSHPFIACEWCKIFVGLPPGSDLVKNHKAAHERWEVEGRPGKNKNS